MLIGLIADTHIPRDAKVLPPQVKDAFRGADLILHAGDIYVPKVLDELEKIAPVLAARGNGDWKFPSDRRLKDSHVLDINGFRLGLTHIIAYPELPYYPLDRTMEKEFGGRVDIAVFGDVEVEGVEDVLSNWERLKSEEKDRESLLDGVPEALPALARADTLQRRAARVGFDWPDLEGVIAKVHEEILLKTK